MPPARAVQYMIIQTGSIYIVGIKVEGKSPSFHGTFMALLTSLVSIVPTRPPYPLLKSGKYFMDFGGFESLERGNQEWFMMVKAGKRVHTSQNII